MRPAVALDCTPLYGQTGGIGTFVNGLLNALVARGEQSLSGYALTWRPPHRLDPVLPAGVRAIRRRLPASALFRSWEYGAWPWAELWTGRVDVVHGTNFVVPPARRAATVVTVHDLTAVRYPELCTTVTLRYPALIRRAVARGAFVHVPSAFVAGEVTDLLGVPADRVRVVAHGVDHVICDATPQRRRSPYLLAVGTVEPRKDYRGLVRAFEAVKSQFDDVRLVIAGEDGWAADEVNAAIAASPAASHIERRRGVDDLTRARLLRGAAALVYPSLYEGFGLPPLEAMAAGTPVVATAAGAVPETVDGGAVLVPVGDPEELAAALGSILADADLRATLRARGLARAQAFTWRACAEGLTQLYADAVDARG